MHPRITHVAVPLPFRTTLTFTDGPQGTVDLAPWIVGKRGVFAALQDPVLFAQVRVDPEAGMISTFRDNDLLSVRPTTSRQGIA